MKSWPCPAREFVPVSERGPPSPQRGEGARRAGEGAGMATAQHLTFGPARRICPVRMNLSPARCRTLVPTLPGGNSFRAGPRGAQGAMREANPDLDEPRTIASPNSTMS